MVFGRGVGADGVAGVGSADGKLDGVDDGSADGSDDGEQSQPQFPISNPASFAGPNANAAS